METRDPKKLNWQRIVKNDLLPSLPGFAARGRLLYQAPVGEVLHAFYIDSSGENQGTDGT